MEGGWELVRIGNQEREEGDLECVHFYSTDIISEDGKMSFTSTTREPPSHLCGSELLHRSHVLNPATGAL